MQNAGNSSPQQLLLSKRKLLQCAVLAVGAPVMYPFAGAAIITICVFSAHRHVIRAPLHPLLLIYPMLLLLLRRCGKDQGLPHGVCDVSMVIRAMEDAGNRTRTSQRPVLHCLATESLYRTPQVSSCSSSRQPM